MPTPTPTPTPGRLPLTNMALQIPARNGEIYCFMLVRYSNSVSQKRGWFTMGTAHAHGRPSLMIRTAVVHAYPVLEIQPGGGG